MSFKDCYKGSVGKSKNKFPERTVICLHRISSAAFPALILNAAVEKALKTKFYCFVFFI